MSSTKLGPDSPTFTFTSFPSKKLEIQDLTQAYMEQNMSNTKLRPDSPTFIFISFPSKKLEIQDPTRAYMEPVEAQKGHVTSYRASKRQGAVSWDIFAGSWGVGGGGSRVPELVLLWRQI